MVIMHSGCQVKKYWKVLKIVLNRNICQLYNFQLIHQFSNTITFSILIFEIFRFNQLKLAVKYGRRQFRSYLKPEPSIRLKIAKLKFNLVRLDFYPAGSGNIAMKSESSYYVYYISVVELLDRILLSTKRNLLSIISLLGLKN